MSQKSQRLTLDDWQNEVMETKGNLCLRSGRQVGKSTVIACKAGEWAVNHEKKNIMVISSVERQAHLLFEKIHAYVYDNYQKHIKMGKDRPTKSRLRLKNGSVIYCLPTGLSGHGIRGYTIDLLIADEAAFIPEEVWTAVTPMLAVTRGTVILLSTPFGREGYFYRCFNDEKYTQFHVSSEDCPRKDDDFLKHEKERMTKLQYAQEYLGEFVDELRQFFPTKLIQSCCILKKAGKMGDTYLGVDVARMGADQSTFEIITKNGNNYIHIDNQITEKTYTTDTVSTILALEDKYKFKKIYIDDAGVGAGVFDMLLKDERTKRKTEGINNSRKSISKDNKKFRRILKNDLYDNLLKLMESSRIQLLDDDEIIQSLRSIQYEYTDDGKIKIFGNYTHITEGLIRAAWCVKDKTLNILAFCK